MTFLPIVARELRVSSRKARTYWGRTGVATAMLVVAAWVFIMVHRQAPSAQAIALFGTLAGAMLFIGGFSGMGTTADALSSEKREGTLGLLFLTPLRGYDVVFGKLCAGSLNVLYGMISVAPIMALPLLIGGVSPGEFARMALLLLNAMLLSLSIGICVSSVSREEKRARGAVLLVIVVFAGGFPLAGAWLEYEMNVRGAAQWFMMFSPAYAFARAWDATQAVPWAGYWVSMIVIHGCTWLFLLLACWSAPRTWQDRPARRKWRLLNLFRVSGDRGAMTTVAFRRRLLDHNAFYWLTTRPHFRVWLLWGVLLCPTLLWLGFGMKYPRDLFSPAMFVFMAITWNGILKAWVASEATRQVASDRRSGSIELLLSTPLTVTDITRGVWLSLKRQLQVPLILVLFGECLLLAVGAREVGGMDARILWDSVWACGMAMLIIDLAALYTVGLWQSAVAKGPAEAAGGTAFRILALPWILYMLLGAAVAVVEGLGWSRWLPDLGWMFWLGGWTLIGFAVDLFFGLRAWKAVHTRFREVASRQAPARGWGYALGRLVGSIKAGRTTNS